MISFFFFHLWCVYAQDSIISSFDISSAQPSSSITIPDSISSSSISSISSTLPPPPLPSLSDASSASTLLTVPVSAPTSSFSSMSSILSGALQSSSLLAQSPATNLSAPSLSSLFAPTSVESPLPASITSSSTPPGVAPIPIVVPLSTSTALPPGASLEPIVVGAFSKNQWTTKTLPDGTMTTGAVIIPGPGDLIDTGPVIIWGVTQADHVFSDLVDNLANVAKVCFNIGIIKIGCNTPKDPGDPGKPGTTEEFSTTEEPKTTSDPSSSQSSSTSCSSSSSSSSSVSLDMAMAGDDYTSLIEDPSDTIVNSFYSLLKTISTPAGYLNYHPNPTTIDFQFWLDLSIPPAGPGPTITTSIIFGSMSPSVDSTYQTAPSQTEETPASSTELVASSTEPGPPEMPAPSIEPVSPEYAPGICSFHLKETTTCEHDDRNLYANVTLLDNDKNVIGSTGSESNGKGPGINAESRYGLHSRLPLPLQITGEHKNDYVQFSYGTLFWPSTKKDGAGQCKVGGWDPKDLNCFGGTGPDIIREMDCSFPCP